MVHLTGWEPSGHCVAGGGVCAGGGGGAGCLKLVARGCGGGLAGGGLGDGLAGGGRRGGGFLSLGLGLGVGGGALAGGGGALSCLPAASHLKVCRCGGWGWGKGLVQCLRAVNRRAYAPPYRFQV